MPFLGCFRSLTGAGRTAGRSLLAVALASVLAAPAVALEENEFALFGIEKSYKNQAAIKHLDAALDVFRRGDGDKALAELEEAYKVDKTLAPGRVLRARMLFALNAQQAITAARTELERSVKDYGSNPHVYLMLGNLALAEGRLTDADLEYKQSMSLVDNSFPTDPKNPDRLRFMRQIYAGFTAVAEGRQEWKAAKQAAASWLSAAAGDAKQVAQAEQRMARAEFFGDNADMSTVNEHLQTAYKNDPEIGHPLVALALLTAQKGDEKNPQVAIDKADKLMRDAVDAIRKESSAKPEIIAGVYAAASQWMLNNNKLDVAANYASDAVKADPKSDAFQRLTALIALYQKQWDQAEKLLDGMYQKTPGDVFVTSNLALALAGASEIKDDDAQSVKDAKKAKLRRAVDLAEINFRSYQRSAELAGTLGWVYFLAERYDEAEQLLQGAVQLNNGQLSSSTAYYLAQVLARRRRLDDAMKILDSALASPGPFPYRAEAVKLMKNWDPSWKERKPEAARATTPETPKAPDTTPAKTDGKTDTKKKN